MDLEEEEDDDLCLILFDLCLFVGKSLLLHLDVCLLSETQVLLSGAMITLGSDM